jgi:pyruvate/2-oxoglutarate/acetoin dehydrogenase E1 component
MLILIVIKAIVAFGEDVGSLLAMLTRALPVCKISTAICVLPIPAFAKPLLLGRVWALAMRGLKPIAEIQYLDYLLYAITVLSDDLASLSYRTRGGQKAPLIIRTRGHRLEGIWHSGIALGY